MSTGRKRRPEGTSPRRAVQEPLPLAAPAASADEPPMRQALAELLMAPACLEKLERQTETLLRRPPGVWDVRWVQCEDCGRGRHVNMAGRHGAMPVRRVTLESAPAWPSCQHAVPYWENCRGAAVAPPCCLEPTP